MLIFKLIQKEDIINLCIATFGISAADYGFVPKFKIMIIGRIFQDHGGDGILPLSQATILESYPKSELWKAMAIFSSGITITPIIGLLSEVGLRQIIRGTTYFL